MAPFPSFLKRSKTLLFLLILWPSSLFATVTFCSLSISNNNPSPGSVVGVTVVYSQNNTFTRTDFLVAVNASANAIQPCPAVNQVILVDSNTGSFGTSPVNSSVADTNVSGGWQGLTTAGTANSCPGSAVTQVFNVTIPAGLSAGSYNLIVKANDYYVDCSSAGASTSTTLTVPYPPANISLIEVADGTTANANDLILWHILYTYGNTGPVTVTANIPVSVTLASGSGAISPGGNLAGSTITWVLPATLPTVTGEVWFLTKVDGSVTAGSIITNSSTAASASAGSALSNTAQVNIGTAGFTLVKSQSSATALPGTMITYTLAYQVSGSSLQSSDSFGNNAVNTANGAILGYDGSTFTYTNLGGVGGFSVQQDGQGNSYIRGCAYSTCNSGVTNGNYPTLLRDTPGVNLCNGFMVEADMQIPAGSDAGADATLVIADNLSAPSPNDAYMLGMSLDNGPGNFFLQKNNSSIPSVTFPSTLGNGSIGTVITAGVWYTAKVLVTYNAGALRFQGKIWPRGTLEPASWSMDVTDASPLPCTPINSGTYKMGFQADGSSSTNYYAGLKIYGPSPVVDPILTDTLPSAVSLISASSTGVVSMSGNFVQWNLGGASPVTTYNLNGVVTTTAMVTCGGNGVNMASINSTGAVSAVNSNAVTLNVTGCFTDTPTPTPTPAGPTATATSTATATLTPTATPSPTATTPLVDEFYVSLNVLDVSVSGSVSIHVGYSIYGGNYSLRVFNSAGEQVRTLAKDRYLNGPVNDDYLWDGKNEKGEACASGVYLLYLVEPLDRKLKKIILIR